MYTILHRPIPLDIDQPEKLRFVDELGRIARFLENALEYLGITPASRPLKVLVDLVLSLLTNPIIRIPDNIKITEEVFNGVKVHVYTPTAESKPLPVFVFFHGGGWTWFSVGTYNAALRNFANKTNHVVIAVDYRKAPQDIFPAAYEDCLAVTEYVLENTQALNIKQDAISLAGDGSGGNIAAAVAITLKEKIKMQLLINPALQMVNFKTPSYQDNEDVLAGLTSPEKVAAAWLRYAGMPLDLKSTLLSNQHISLDIHKKYWKLLNSKYHVPKYLNVTNKMTIYPREKANKISFVFDELIADVRFCPMLTTKLDNLPSTYIITSQYDVLRDEAIMYSHRLQQAGVKVKLRHYKNGFHGFFHFAHRCLLQFKSSKLALEHLVSFINFNNFHN
ncbi:hypothetical protein SNE40_008466 [Patella caerulea]|uniref:Alpha/beta hydrolase fold-3 domain-containing protein n=1 Tax=Patella caerulea TaxID=87958 RepID=A0AAN8K6P6_PATCE